MYRKLIFLLSFVLLLSLIGSTSAEPIITGDLSIYFSYDSFEDLGLTVPDESPPGDSNTHDGGVVGDIFCVPNGKRGGAAQFSGFGSYLDLDGPNFDPLDIPAEAITLAAWVKC
ncbi:MAG: hypothetical protein KAV87_41555, partial [Desulfobacteraceae bacterium]|nr:hypothetical protein [Desulfobacteraceae bacterium]